MSTVAIILVTATIFIAAALTLLLLARRARNLQNPKTPGIMPGASHSEAVRPKVARRAFLVQAARGAVATFAGWMAVRGSNLPWAASLVAEGKDGATLPPANKPVEYARGDHSDSHSDSHDDVGHIDVDTHNDVEINKVHVDLGGHTDSHIDGGHTDSHYDS